MKQAHVPGGLALLALLVLAGCASSPPMSFYTLGATGETGAASSGELPEIRVARVKLPGEIDRAEIVQRIDANRVRLAEQDRWAAPLEDMIRRTLSANLQARAPASAAVGAQGAAPGGGTVNGAEPAILSVDIEEFIGDSACTVSLRAAWELKASGAVARSAHGYESIRVVAPATCDVSALPGAMSQALAELSDRIVRAGMK